MQKPLGPIVNRLQMVFSRKLIPVKPLPNASLISIGRNSQSRRHSPLCRVASQVLCLQTRTYQNNLQTAKQALLKDQIFINSRKARRMKMKFPLNHLHPTWKKLPKSKRAQLTRQRRRAPRKEVRQHLEDCLSQYTQDRLYLTECLCRQPLNRQHHSSQLLNR